MKPIRERTWDAALSLIESLRESQNPYREKLKRLISCSSELLHPLSEPLLIDNPLISMLASVREESYSDWLAWSLEQFELPRALAVLGIEQPVIGTVPEGLRFEAKRECFVPSGHHGSSGRLDIRILSGTDAIADIEVKIVPAEYADTAKQTGYEQFGAPDRVLIAPSGNAERYEGNFKLRTWGDVCVALRGEVHRLATSDRNGRDGVGRAGLILAFVAAVEQNLLKVAAPRLRAIFNRNAKLILSADGTDIEYLERCIREERHGE